jgi:hypothetical protein
MADEAKKTTADFRFKPVEGGYLFRAPSALLFWGVQQYRLSEAERQRLIDLTREPTWVAVVWLIGPVLIIIAAGMGLLFALYQGGEPGPESFLEGVVIALIAFLGGFSIAALRNRRRMTPVLSEAEKVSGGFTFGETYAAARAAMPTKAYVTSAISSGFIFGMGMFVLGFDLGLALGRSHSFGAGLAAFGKNANWLVGLILAVAGLAGLLINMRSALKRMRD